MEKKNLFRIGEVTLIDYGITKNEEKFVTEICIPVKKPNAAKQSED